LESHRSRGALYESSIQAVFRRRKQFLALTLGCSPQEPSSLDDGAKATVTTSVVASGLASSTGLALTADHSLLIDQRPFAPRDATVAKLDLRTGAPPMSTDLAGLPQSVSSTAVAANADQYQANTEEGAIYRRMAHGTSSRLGPPELLLAGLDHPLAVAPDPSGTILSFTEVPTPGLGGELGGRNTINVFDLTTRTRTVLNHGDAQPAGIALAADGTVYWANTARGMVMSACSKRSPTAPLATYTATLNGANEVPPVMTAATALRPSTCSQAGATTTAVTEPS
jgi:hypothetical protein